MPRIPNANDLRFSKDQAYINSKTDVGTANLLQLMDPQNKNKFDMLIYPSSLRGNLSASSNVEDNIMKFHLQGIDVPFMNISYEIANEKKYIKDLQYPEEIVLTLFEDEKGSVRKYAKLLMDDIAIWDPTRQSWLFRDDQLTSKKDAYILLQGGLSDITNGIIFIKGMKFKTHNNVTLTQQETEYLVFDFTFAVDSVGWEIYF